MRNLPMNGQVAPLTRPLPPGAPFDPLMRFQPDLLPVTSQLAPGAVRGPAGFCRRDAQGNLLVEILNLGGRFSAPPSTTRVLYQNGQFIERPTPALGPDQSVILTFPSPFEFPSPTPERMFTIIADVYNRVTERNKQNNIAVGICLR